MKCLSKKTLIIIILIHFLLLTNLSIAKHNNLPDWDLVEHESIISYSINGEFFYNEVTNENHLYRHAFFFAVFLMPFYYLFPSSSILLILQTAAFSLAGLLLFKLMQKKGLPEKFSFLLLIVYFFSAYNVYVNLEEFHFIVFAVPLIILAFYTIETSKPKTFVITLILLLLVKENMIFIGLFLGLYLFINKNTLWKKTILISGAYLVLTLLLLTSIYSGIIDERYNLGAQDDLNSPANNLKLNVKNYAIGTFTPFLFLPFFNSASIVAAPTFFQNTLSSDEFQNCFVGHHSIPLITIFFISTILFLAKIFTLNKRLFFILASYFIIVQIIFSVWAYGMMFNENGYENTIFDSCITTGKSSSNKLIIDGSFIHRVFDFTNNGFNKKTYFDDPKEEMDFYE
ncbi:DUF2079 domain-containing protein [archaeon]|nr:DUF2079 domain-containing protein [archaeon]